MSGSLSVVCVIIVSTFVKSYSSGCSPSWSYVSKDRPFLWEIQYRVYTCIKKMYFDQLYASIIILHSCKRYVTNRSVLRVFVCVRVWD
jgi:hypothetical protein